MSDTDTLDQPKTDAGTFVGQVRQNGYIYELVHEEATCWRQSNPFYEQWNGQAWVPVSMPQDPEAKRTQSPMKRGR